VLVQGPYDYHRTIEQSTDYTKPSADAYGGDPTQPNRPSGDSQLYDPATGMWHRIVVPVQEHDHMDWNSKAVLLANGTVLVVPGGFAGTSPALVYDPAATDPVHPSGTWFPTASMLFSDLAPPVATLLGDGRRVLVGTGSDTEIYDPGVSVTGRGSWIPAGRLPYRLSGETATTLADGRVLVVGGSHGQQPRPPTSLLGIVPLPGGDPENCASGPENCGSRTVFVYDPSTGT